MSLGLIPNSRPIEIAQQMFEKLYLDKEQVKTLVHIQQIRSGKYLLNQQPHSLDISSQRLEDCPGRNYEISMDLAIQTITNQ